MGQKRLRTRLLIGADGSSSLISRILRGAKPRRRDQIIAVRAYFEGVEGAKDQADLYINSSPFPGYYWLFPTGAHSANLGVGVLLEAWRPKQEHLGQLVAQLIESDPAIRRRLAGAKIRDKIVGWPLAIFNPKLPIVADRVALIGDAAGLINPLNGEGIQYALRSGRWIVETLQDAIVSDSLSAAGLHPYAARVQAEMRYDMAVCRLIVDLASNRMLTPLSLWMVTVVAQRALSDSEYYNVAAGVFAGILQARELLTLRFLWRTLKSAVVAGSTAANELLHGNATLRKAVVSMFKYSAAHPVATLGWVMHCALSAVELALQMTMSARQNTGIQRRIPMTVLKEKQL